MLSGEATTDPKNASIEPLRALTVSRRSAVKAQQAAWRQIQAVLINAPAHLRDRYRNLSVAKLVAALAGTRPDLVKDPDEADILHALRSLARRHRQLGEETTQLRSRHWIITDGNGSVQEVRGDGVVGAQPVLRPGENFEYTSWCVLATPSGTMRGTYQMVTDRGQSFDADIAPFRLALPATLN